MYRRQKDFQTATATPPPPPLKKGLAAYNQDWVYRKTDGPCPIIEIRARDVETLSEPDERILLKGVELKLFHDCGNKFDFVHSDSAEFNKTAETLYADGEVSLSLAVPAKEEELEKPGRLVTISSSGVIVEAKTGKARTERLTKFAFDLGDGYAIGAAYDPQIRQLDLLGKTVLHWRGRDAQSKPMTIEAGKLVYTENDDKVRMSPWSKFKRDNLSLEGGDAVLTLEKGNIRLVEAQNAHGTNTLPQREMTFGARELRIEMNEKSIVEKIAGTGEAHLETKGKSGRTDMKTDRVDLDFTIADGESVLTKALASGHSRVESHPVVQASGKTPPSRILASEVIETRMREGGEEVEAMETHSPGRLDLVPNNSDQPRRQLNASKIWIAYGEKNTLRSFRAVQVTTETRKPRPAKAKTDPPPAVTSSKDLLAEFHPETGDMTKLEQWNDFQYKEGDREAVAQHATLEQGANQILLERSTERQARMWDPTGSVTADKILMNETTGDFTADGKVVSSRLPDRKTAQTNAMLSQDEPMNATAARMVSKDRNRRVTYEGGAVLWQTANRLQADRVFIDRETKTVDAQGNVVSQFLDKKTDPKTGKRLLTAIRSTRLEYNDSSRQALYSGGVRMIREDMDVKSKQLRAWLNESKPDAKDDSTLHHAFADGAVEIAQSEKGRTRRGTSEHAEFWVVEDKVILNGGIAMMVDSLKGVTRGRQITYYSRKDTFEVEGAPAQPAVSKVRLN